MYCHSDLLDLKVVELRKILRNAGLSSTGKKEILCQRILDNNLGNSLAVDRLTSVAIRPSSPIKSSILSNVQTRSDGRNLNDTKPLRYNYVTSPRRVRSPIVSTVSSSYQSRPTLRPNSHMDNFLTYIQNTKDITAPTTLSVYKLNDKLIWNFADSHVNDQAACLKKVGAISVESYLDTWFKQSGLCCDFFLETAQFLNIKNFKVENIRVPEPIQELDRVRRKYIRCLSPAKKDAKIWAT